MITDGEYQYAAVIVKTGSAEFLLKAPDDTTVGSWTDRPTARDAVNTLDAAGYDTSAHIPYRDMTLSDETLPDGITTS